MYLFLSAQVKLTSVERTERQSQETVIVAVLNELTADLGSSFDGLALGSDTANIDHVHVDVAASGTAVSVGNRPASSAHFRGVAGRHVDIMSSLRCLRQLI